ncbi:MAG: hypothetical protein AAF741_08300 [Bacteroidota bacterium]
MKLINYFPLLAALMFGALVHAQDPVYEVNLASIVELSISLDENCQAEIIPSMVLTGNFDVDGDGFTPPDDLFTIVIFDGNQSNGNIIDGCGRFAYNVMWDPSIIGIDDLDGFITGEDDIPASFVVPPTAHTGLLINQYDGITVDNLPGSVSRCYSVDGSTGTIINNTLDPALNQRLAQGGTLPTVFDGCVDVEICVDDHVISTDACSDMVIRRTFTAQDANTCSVGHDQNPSVSSSVDITFQRPGLNDVQDPVTLVQINCNEADLNGPNPAAQGSDYPTITTNSGDLSLINPVGSVSAVFTDGPRSHSCANAYQFVRTYQVIDACSADPVMVFSQIVQVGDFTVPTIEPPTQDLDFDGIPDDGPLVFTTNTADCGTFLFPLAGVNATDFCSGMANLTAFIYLNEDLSSFPLGPYVEGEFSNVVPQGNHIIRYIGSDNCNNVDTLDVGLLIVDQTEPVAICEDGLIVSLDGNGQAIIEPEDVDRASYDECGNFLLEIAEATPSGNAISLFDEQIIVDCSDIPTKSVLLRITDDGNIDGNYVPGIDNSNTCLTQITISDQSAPACIPPLDQVLNCTQVDPNLPEDLGEAFSIDPFGTSALLDQLFGTATGVDNCQIANSGQSVLDNRGNCGSGTILRKFSFADGAGLTAPNCQQSITVTKLHDYSLIFPADESSQACVEPDYNGLEFSTNGCDLITVNTSIDSFLATGQECYKLRVTYEVINWCEYDTESNPYSVPRDADNDDFLEEITVLHVTPGNLPNVLDDDIAYLDNDGIRSNGFISPLDNGDPFGQRDGAEDDFGYGRDGARGAFRYRQFIGVHDEEPPIIDLSTLTASGADTDGDCFGDYSFSFEVRDNCTLQGISTEVELDLFATDNDGDGVYALADFIPVNVEDFSEGSGITVMTSNEFDTEVEVDLTDIPIGRHAARVRSSDGCGNTSIELIIFDLLDLKAPTPVCIEGLTVTLAPDGEGDAIGVVSAETFLVHSLDDCSGDVNVAIYRNEDSDEPDFVPDPEDDLIEVDCEDLGLLPVRIFTIDPMGNFDKCETTLSVQSYNNTLCGGLDVGLGNVHGSISTYSNDPVPGAMINVTGTDMDDDIMTDMQGEYEAEGLMLGEDYTLSPSLESNVDLSTVTTADIILLMQHLLGVQELDNPYQYIAADVTGDGTLNVQDIVAMRRVILGLTDGFPDQPSWRFVDINHDFGADVDDWTVSNIPQIINLNDFEENVYQGDFVAIAMGDISGNALNANAHERIAEARAVAQVSCEDLQVRAGNNYLVSIYAEESMAGMQGTIEVDDDLKLLDVEGVIVGDQEINKQYMERGFASFSVSEPLGAGAELFRLHLRAMADCRLSNKLRISDVVTPAEAYPQAGEIANLRLSFVESATGLIRSGFQVDQNYPNPVSDWTVIGFTLPEAGRVEMAVYDQIGRTLLLRSMEGYAGYNHTRIELQELGDSANGNLTYTLRYKDQFVTNKMSVVR